MCDVIYLPKGPDIESVAQLRALVGDAAMRAGLEAGDRFYEDECLCPLHIEKILDRAGITWALDETGVYVVTEEPPRFTFPTAP